MADNPNDCVQARITQNIIDTLETITAANGYQTTLNTVSRLRTTVQFNANDYWYALLIENEQEPQSEYQFRDDIYSYLIWIFPGINDNTPDLANTEISYVMRNTGADVTKALKADITRGGLAQYTKITKWDVGCMETNEMVEFGLYTFIEVQALTDSKDPYKTI